MAHAASSSRESGRFLAYMDDHHGDGRSRSGVPLAPDMQSLLTDASPEAYFSAAVRRHRAGSVCGSTADWRGKEIAGLIEDAYLTVALGEARSGGPRAQRGGVAPSDASVHRSGTGLRRRADLDTGGVGAVVLKGLLLLGYHRVILYEVVLNPVPPPTARVPVDFEFISRDDLEEIAAFRSDLGRRSSSSVRSR